ncbi:hypothetical protein ACWKSP_26315 [Micromonosporaceae bacterium Da 78-11]
MTTQPAVKTRLIDAIGELHLHESVEGTASLYATTPGGTKPIAGAWGPAADNDNWFAWRAGTDPIRVDSRSAAITYITAPSAEEATA